MAVPYYYDNYKYYVLCVTGDLYGGAHYSKLCSANLTLQGKAMQDVAWKFGDGQTLPFTPCKKGYKPMSNNTSKIIQMYACPLHDKERRKRVIKEGNTFRKGEVDLNIFWNSTTTASVGSQPIESSVMVGSTPTTEDNGPTPAWTQEETHDTCYKKQRLE